MRLEITLGGAVLSGAQLGRALVAGAIDGLRALAGLAVAALVVEVTARLVQLNARPAFPLVVDSAGATRLPPNLDIVAKFPTLGRAKLVTDGLGVRVADRKAAGVDRTDGVLFVGDSQVLGWGLRFEDTAASRLAKQIGVAQDKVYILASAAEDPEKQLPWAKEYTALHRQNQKIEVVSLNLGNDLEEVYFSRSLTSRPTDGGVTEWLLCHSLAYLDFSLLRGNSVRRSMLPPEVNYSMLMLSESQRHTLANGIVDAMARLANVLPPTGHRVVMVVPQDTQISMSEFLKYRRSYPDDADYQRHKALQALAAQRLDGFQDEVASMLRQRGFNVVVLEPLLRRAYRPGLIDPGSSHLLAPGQQIEADAIASAVGGAR